MDKGSPGRCWMLDAGCGMGAEGSPDEWITMDSRRERTEWHLIVRRRAVDDGRGAIEKVFEAG